MSNKKITVVGIGYVGLPAALLLAKVGHEVVGLDIDQVVVDSVNNKTLVVEESLQGLLVDDNVCANFKASTTITPSDVFIVAVPTPLQERSKCSDLSALKSALYTIADVLKKGDLVIVESTIPPLTCKELITPIFENKGFLVGSDIFLAHCPERLLPGNILEEITMNMRLVGGVNTESSLRAKSIYESFVKGDIVVTDDVTAELCKLMENTYRDVNIALANEIYEVATKIGVNPFEAIRLANMHPRVDILQPGIGVGGHCLPIDPWFISEVDPYDCNLIQTARRINDSRPHRIASQIRQLVASVDNPKILFLGCTYKEETNDIRESPALKIASLLEGDGYNVTRYDPVADVGTETSLYELVTAADCVAVLVQHKDMLTEFNDVVSGLKKNQKHVPIVYKFDEYLSS